MGVLFGKGNSSPKKNASIGAILPWSFLLADYAVALRNWLVTMFSEIKILSLGSHQFDNAQERLVLAWMKGYGSPNSKLLLGTANNPDEHVKYNSIRGCYWCRQIFYYE